MKNKNYSSFIAVLACLLLIVMSGCNSKAKEEKPKAANNTALEQKLPQNQTLPPAASSTAPPEPSATVVEVDGKKLTQGQLDKEIKNSFAAISAQVPADHVPRVKEDLRKKLINDFIMRTLLSDEVNRKKINVTEAEVTEAINQLKASLPPSVKIEDIIKKNHSTEKEMREEVSLGIKINKMVIASLGGKIKPTEKEITEFYQKNKDKLKVPESVQARHILIATTKTDNDKTKAEKKAKAEGLRKQLLAGADFTDLAKKNSDCPSKEKGGDLGAISRGQMVKPFEDAAFSQKKDAIGPVVETDFGYHIIQVLKHNEPQTLNLDDKIKAEIASFLEREKMQKTFASTLERLKAKATIMIHGQ